MSRARQLLDFTIENAAHWAVLAIVLAYTYARLFEVPYKGFDLNAQGTVLDIFVQGSRADPLQIGDRLIQVGNLKWEDYIRDDTAILFEGLTPGQTVPIILERNGDRKSISWIYPGRNVAEFMLYAVSGIWLGYFFWLVGLMLSVHLRPKGEQRAVAIAFSYLLAVGIVLGGESRVWYSARLFMCVFFLGVPLSLHFHWLWPTPLGKLPAAIKWAAYALAVVAAIAAILGRMPMEGFLAGLAIGVLGSLILLALHAIFQSALRPGLVRMAIIGTVAMLPQAAYPLLYPHVSAGLTELVTSAGLPLLPIAYAASVYHLHLDNLELRVNRLTSAYLFLVALGIILLPLITAMAIITSDPAAVTIMASLVGMATAVAAIYGFPLFQSLVERRLFKLPVASTDLAAAYASRIITCTTIPQLVTLLREEVLPSLVVREFAFLHFDGASAETALLVGVENGDIPDERSARVLLDSQERRGDGDSEPGLLPYRWIRASVPLRAGQSVIGAWLMGKRDPDDVYRPSDMAVIRSLADQTAISLSNIVQAQRLRELSQANVSRNEEARLRLALQLHDSVLNHMAAALMKLDGPSMTPAIQESFAELGNRVRAIVGNLRPPMLAYGLRLALEELAETLSERSDHPVNLALMPSRGEVRYPPAVELHVFRIVQESCENALRHASADNISISGRLEKDRIEILVQDDGAGFEVPRAAALESWIARNHFGLAGLVERANLIGGQVSIRSAPGTGTRVLIKWSSGNPVDPSQASQW